jgi:hypothetical protein
VQFFTFASLPNHCPTSPPSFSFSFSLTLTVKGCANRTHCLAKETNYSHGHNLSRTGGRLVQTATARSVAMHAPPATVLPSACLLSFFARSGFRSPTKRLSLRPSLVSLKGRGGDCGLSHHPPVVQRERRNGNTAVSRTWSLAAPYVYRLWESCPPTLALPAACILALAIYRTRAGGRKWYRLVHEVILQPVQLDGTATCTLISRDLCVFCGAQTHFWLLDRPAGPCMPCRSVYSE